MHPRFVDAPCCGQMGKSDGAFRFVGAAMAHRTPRIPPEKWEEHKAEVTEIYLKSKKLADVVVQMRDRHGFNATQVALLPTM